MERAYLTVPEYPSTEEKKRGGVDGEMIEWSVSVEGCGYQEKRKEKGGQGGSHPRPPFG